MSVQVVVVCPVALAVAAAAVVLGCTWSLRAKDNKTDKEGLSGETVGVQTPPSPPTLHPVIMPLANLCQTSFGQARGKSFYLH